MFGICAVADKTNVVGAVDVKAKMLLSRTAHVALSAIEIGPEYDALAGLEAACAGISHYAAEFMPHPEVAFVIRIPALAGFPHMDV